MALQSDFFKHKLQIFQNKNFFISHIILYEIYQSVENMQKRTQKTAKYNVATKSVLLDSGPCVYYGSLRIKTVTKKQLMITR